MILATILLVLLSYLLYQFGLRRTQAKPDVRFYLPAFVVFGALLLLTSIFALNDLLTALAPRSLEPIHTTAALREAFNVAEIGNEQVLLEGAIGEVPDGTIVSTSAQMVFPMQLDDDVITIMTDEDTLAIQWPQDDSPDNPRVLATGQAITVLGLPTDATTVTADAIYAGDVQAYWNFIPRFAVLPSITLILSLIAGLVVMAIPFVRYRQLPPAAEAD